MLRQYFPQSRSWWGRFLLFHVLRSDRRCLNSSPDLPVTEIPAENSSLPILECQKSITGPHHLHVGQRGKMQGLAGDTRGWGHTWQTQTRDGAGRGTQRATKHCLLRTPHSAKPIFSAEPHAPSCRHNPDGADTSSFGNWALQG